MARTLTNEEFKKVDEIIRNTKWVENMVNQHLLAGEGWNKIMFQIAEAFGVIKIEEA